MTQQKRRLILRKLLFGNPDKTSARLSPDGTQISYLTRLLLAITLVSATLMYILRGFLTNVDVFWSHSPQSSIPSLVQELLEFTKFPLPIYQRSIQLLLTWLLP